MGAKIKALLIHPAYLLGLFATGLSALISMHLIPSAGLSHNLIAGILAGLAAAGITTVGVWTPPATSVTNSSDTTGGK